MKITRLTIKQQAKVFRSINRIFKDIGFQYDNASLGKSEGFWWRKIPQTENRICVGFNVTDQCLGGKTGWVWKTARLNEWPKFGYSGSTSVGASFGTIKRILDITFEHFYYAGTEKIYQFEKEKRLKIKEEILAIANKI